MMIMMILMIMASMMMGGGQALIVKTTGFFKLYCFLVVTFKQFKFYTLIIVLSSVTNWAQSPHHPISDFD